ncbi:hypothetical protein D3C72_2401570 [compost metagenome]
MQRHIADEAKLFGVTFFDRVEFDTHVTEQRRQAAKTDAVLTFGGVTLSVADV